ncbi:MAG: hypothetical protein SXV54_09865 [Chloroflexota bacterium]|nr:hypothetical protein [Chloroflexota bacterium]
MNEMILQDALQSPLLMTLLGFCMAMVFVLTLLVGRGEVGGAD